MGRAPGFAEWNPKLAGFHNIEIAVVDSTNGPILVAHHGVPLVAPENTLAGVRAACELGIPGVEVDVRFTRDSVPVLLHDRDIGRTSNGSGFVDQTGLLQLKALDFGSWFNSAYAGEPIPTLVEFLMEARACGFRLVQLDVKSYAPVGIDSGWMRIARAVQAESLFSKTDFGGPDLNILQRGRTLTPGAHTVLFVLSVTQPLADAVIAAHVDGVGVSFDGYALSSDVLSHLDSLGIRIGVYAPPSVLSVNGLSPFPKIVTTDWDWRLVN
jgi:glycerophosphoryl diester phosphodiesterase